MGDTPEKELPMRGGAELSHTSAARLGDIVRIDLDMSPEGGYVPESLFDTHGQDISFVLGWGNYLPGLHQLVEGCKVGDVVTNVSIDAGYGSRQDDLMFEVPCHKLEKIILGNNNNQPVMQRKRRKENNSSLQVGDTLNLEGGVQVLVHEIQEKDSIVIVDANHPLAGTSYSCSFRVLDVTPMDPSAMFGYRGSHDTSQSRYDVATFALGCFWGAELAFARCSGVVGTRVGYSQGTTESPTYEEVCEGGTHHRESVVVVFDKTETSYTELMNVAMERLDQTSSPSMGLNLLFEETSESRQYKHGFYFHTTQQQNEATSFLKENGKSRSEIECIAASTFYLAEEYHQQYLYKGGQSTRKGCRDTIRCFG